MNKILRNEGPKTRRIPLKSVDFPSFYFVVHPFCIEHIRRRAKFYRFSHVLWRHRTQRFADEREHVGHRQLQLFEMSWDISQSTVLFIYCSFCPYHNTGENCYDRIHSLLLRQNVCHFCAKFVGVLRV